jgi:hypothetical protein
MSATIGISWDLALTAIACLPAIVAFVRGRGPLRYFSLGCGLAAVSIFAFIGITHHPGESLRLYPFAGVAAWWFMGLLFAALAVRIRAK